VAGFIGAPQMNFFRAALKQKDDKYFVRVSGIELELPAKRQEQLKQYAQKQTNVELGIRPEHIKIVPEGTKNAIKAEMEVYELMGSEVYFHMKVDGENVVIREQTTDLDGSILNNRGIKSINFILHSSRMHLFELETGRSLFSKRR
jgi:multiple sugar transport system ATP-binding protein